MTRLNAIAVFSCLLALFFLLLPSPTFASAPPAAIMEPDPVAPHPQAAAAHNPYDSRLASLEAQLDNATAPQSAVLVERIYTYREFVDDPARITRVLEKVAGDSERHQLVRDEALRYLAYVDVHENRIAAGEARLKSLGFVRAWAVSEPFPDSEGLDGSYGPELTTAGPKSPAQQPGQNKADATGDANGLKWRRLPIGPTEAVDLAESFSPRGPTVVFAASSVYSGVARRVALRFTADSGIAVFVNGARVFADADSGSGDGFDQHAAGVDLQAGWNRVMLKLTHSGQGPWHFALRITELNGRGVPLRADADRTEDVFHCGGSPCVPSSAPGGEPADLLDLAKAAVTADPGSASALETLGRLEHLHARGTGLQHLQAAARRAPTAERWLAITARCADSACVFGAVNSALRYDPQNEPARVALANYYFGRNQLEKARNLLREAAQLAPADYVARNNLAELYVSVGLNALALKEVQQLQGEFPGPLWLKRKLGSRYLDLGLLDRAQQVLSSALEHNYDGAEERSLLVQIARRRHDVQALRSAYEQAAALHPEDPSPLADLAELATGTGDYVLADRYMRAAIDISPEDGGLRERWSNLLARSGRAQEAREQLVRAAEFEPQNEVARMRLNVTSSGGKQAGSDTGYLANPAELAAAARHNPPAITGNAVALSDVRIERVYANGLSAIREQQVFYIATEQGARDYGTRSVQYAPASQDLRFIHARVYKADGRILQADEAGEDAVADTNVSMYYDVRSRVLHFPALQRGDIIELDYRISPSGNFNPYGDYFGGLVIFRSKVAEKLHRYVLITPVGRQFNILAQRVAPAAVTTSTTERTYRWEVHDSAPLSNEPRGPAVTDIAPYVHVSTFSSWDELGRWYAQLIQPQFTLDSSLRDAATHLLKGTRTEPERISAVHQFVLRNTHYVALEFGIYSYKPYPVAQIYARRFGDCKDKASLMIALLRQAGIQADIALVRTRRLGELNPQATSVALFNHAIVYVPKYDLWIDGTAEYAGSHELPLEDQGATALVIGLDGKAELRHIPITQPTDNYMRRTVRAQVLANGRIQFSGVTYTRGENAPGLRRDYESPERQRDAVRNSLAEVFPSVHVEEVKVDGASDLERPVTVEFRGTLDSFGGRTIVPLASSWLPRTYVQTMAPQTARTQDLLLPAPWTAEEELHFELPAGATVAAMPPNAILNTTFGSASLHYEHLSREIVVRTSVQFRKLRIPPAEYDAFREFCVQVERAFHKEVRVQLGG